MIVSVVKVSQLIHVCHQQSKVDHSSRDRFFVLVRIDVWQDSRQTEIGLKMKNKNLNFQMFPLWIFLNSQLQSKRFLHFELWNHCYQQPDGQLACIYRLNGFSRRTTWEIREILKFEWWFVIKCERHWSIEVNDINFRLNFGTLDKNFASHFFFCSWCHFLKTPLVTTICKSFINSNLLNPHFWCCSWTKLMIRCPFFLFFFAFLKKNIASKNLRTFEVIQGEVDGRVYVKIIQLWSCASF